METFEYRMNNCCEEETLCREKNECCEVKIWKQEYQEYLCKIEEDNIPYNPCEFDWSDIYPQYKIMKFLPKKLNSKSLA